MRFYSSPFIGLPCSYMLVEEYSKLCQNQESVWELVQLGQFCSFWPFVIPDFRLAVQGILSNKLKCVGTCWRSLVLKPYHVACHLLCFLLRVKAFINHLLKRYRWIGRWSPCVCVCPSVCLSFFCLEHISITVQGIILKLHRSVDDIEEKWRTHDSYLPLSVCRVIAEVV